MIRITGGEFRGRILKTPQGSRTRPTQARLRQALFNSLQNYIADARVLDLFAGSGALGLESLSRGASSVVLVEDSRSAVKLIESNARDLGVFEQMTLLADSVDKVQKELARLAPFDIILADPPYAGGWEMKLLNEFPWGTLLADGGHFCLEWGTQKSKVEELPDAVFQLVKVREKNYGDSVLTTYKKCENAEGPAEGNDQSEHSPSNLPGVL